MSWLPAPFPDETLHSMFSRYHKLSYNGDYRNSLQELIGRRICNSLHDLPTFLSEFSHRANNSIGYSLERLIIDHTAYPYFSRFLRADQIDMCRARVEGNMHRRGGGRGLGFAHIRGQLLPRFCSQCVEADLSMYGQPYWHRIHQLPGVWICPWHKNFLKYVDDAWLAKDRRRLFLPDDPCIDSIARDIDSESSRDLLAALATSSSALLFHDSMVFDLNDAHRATRNACEALGFIINGQVYSKRLAAYMLDFFQSMPSSGEFYFLQPVRSGGLPGWVLEVLRSPYRYRFPLEYLCLWEALGIKLTEMGVTFDCGEALDNHLKVAVARQKRKYTRQGVSESEYARRRNDYLTDENQYPSKRKSYQWLLKHDREWLSGQKEPNHSGRKKGFSVEKWLKRDAELSSSILTVAELIRSRSRMPVRVTIGSVFRELGLSRGLLRYLDRMPKSLSVLQMVSESRFGFMQRRISCAYREIMISNGCCDQDSVFRIAHMHKPDNWLQLIERAKSDYVAANG
ncbi:TPA: TniQ family protein [Pseudomonas aeruginosa]|nr:TniQ family protein [Pseudomonas aeruginosa]HEJ2657456.1 TniQ family protein [Pseudomonas aeruginosa]